MTPTAKNRLKKILLTLGLLEVIYLVLINIALSLPLTQTLLNQLKPDKFSVSWESAWSWYPFRVHATGISANGQTGKQQWQVVSPEASASINLIPLLWKSVSLSSVNTTDVDFRLRPRPREGKDYSKIRPYFAPIENRELETKPPRLPPLKKKRPWDISINGISATGKHSVWVYQLQMALAGELEASLDVQTRGGPFSLSDGFADVDIDSIVINGNREVVKNGHLKGSVAFSPFIPRDNKGLKSLEYLSVDADIRTVTDSLAFLNIYLEGFHGMKVSGRGNVDGHVSYYLGNLQAGNDVRISADELSVDLLDYRAQGSGAITLEVDETTPDVMAFEIKFAELKGLDRNSNDVLATGSGMTFSGRGKTQLLPVNGDERIASYLAIGVPSLKVPDLAMYQRFLPVAGSFKLLGGVGELQGKVELTQTGISGFSRLSSKKSDVEVKDFEFISDLDINLNIDAPNLADTGVDVAGSYFRMENARISNEEVGSSEPWQASIDIDQGRLKFLLPGDIDRDSSLKDLLAGIKGHEILPMLDSDSEQLKLRGMFSDLSWLNVLLKNRFNLNIKGAGDITADVVIASGWPAPGTDLRIKPKQLVVEVLDYVATGGGGGHLTLAVDKGGENPDIVLDVKLANASFKRKNDERAFVEDTEILLRAVGRNMSYDKPTKDIDLHLQIPSAEVTDMSVYNSYLPAGAPLQILGGRAELRADVLLKPESAGGFVKLVTSGMHGIIDKQEIEAELDADIKLAGGIPEHMEFDIAGSSLHIKNVKVKGDKKNFNDDHWGIQLALNEAHATWKKPVALDLKASIHMTDSRPFVAMMANHKGKEGWLGKALTVEDVKGEAMLQMKNNNMVIPLAYASSEKIGVGAKGLINADAREGIFYVRFRKLDGILKMRNGKRNIDILKAREKFDQYLPGESKLRP